MATPLVTRAATTEELALLNAPSQAAQTQPTPAGMIPLLNEEELGQESWYQDPVMVGRMLVDGFTWGFSDEATAALRGVINKTIRQDPRSYGEIYAETIQGLEQTRNEYAEEFPAASMVGTITGALPSGGLVAGGVRQLGGRLATAIPTAAAMISPRLGAVLSGGTTLATEGAVSGVGFAQQGEDLSEAAMSGATTNLMLGTALKGVGSAFNLATTRRVAEDLGTGADFRPLPVAAPESNLARAYSNIVGRTYFGSNLLEQQVNRWRIPLARNIEEESNALKNLGSFGNIEQSVNKQIKDAQKELDEIMKGRFKDLDETTAANLERDTARITSINGARATRIEDAVNMRERLFREQAVRAAAPADTPKETLETIIRNSNSMQDVLGSLRTSWKDNGYKYLERTPEGSVRSFNVDPAKVLEDINAEIGSDSASFSLQFGGAPTRAVELVNEYLQETVSGGVITGERLSNLRSSLGSMRGSLMEQGGEAAQRGFVIGKVLNSINDNIKSQLSPTDLAKFNSDNTAWNASLVLQDAIGRASTTPGRRGAFDAKEWLAAARSVNPRRFQEGNAVLQRDADALGSLQTRRDSLIQGITQHTNLRQKQALEARKALVAREQDYIRSYFAEQAAETAQGARATGVQQTAEQAQMAQRQAALTQSQQELAAIDRAMPRDGVAGSNLANLALMSTSAVTGGPMGAATYLMAGRLAATPTFQRALAGQTQAQQTARNFVERMPTENIRGAAGVESVREDQQNFRVDEQQRVARLGTDAAKATAYRRLEAAGQLDNLRQRNFSTFKVLENAYKKQTEQQQ
jgi:hypothetical protein